MKPESWNITVGLRLPVDTKLAAVNLIAAFDYETTEYVNMQMESLVNVQFQTL